MLFRNILKKGGVVNWLDKVLSTTKYHMSIRNTKCHLC